MSYFEITYTVLGGLGLFFYGMKGMSESFQALASDTLRKVISLATANKYLAIFLGMFVTLVIQSSSVTSVMVIGMVNAGLMGTGQAIGVLLGANIGTTITGWIISIKVGQYGLLLLGPGIFLNMFSKKEHTRNLGRAIFGVGLIFFGLTLMGRAFIPLRDSSEFLEAISYFSGHDYGAYFASILLGCLLTMLLQSSTAILGMTIALASSGIIELHTALGLVLGENIGTTLTAQLAAVGGNSNAKRVASAHAIFNILAVGITITIFPFFVTFIEWLVPGEANLLSESNAHRNIAIHIATGHTVFNVAGVLFFLPFISFLEKIVYKIYPDKVQKEENHLVLFGSDADIMPATALLQAEEQNVKFKEIVDRMFNLTEQYIKSDKIDARALAKIKSYEKITDNIKKEVTNFVCKLLEKRLSHDQSVRSQVIVRVAEQLESIADYIDKLATYKTKFCEIEKLQQDESEELSEFVKDVKEFYTQATRGLRSIEEKELEKIDCLAFELKRKSERLREKHIERVLAGKYDAHTSLAFSDMVVSLRKIRSHSHNIVQSLTRVSQ